MNMNQSGVGGRGAASHSPCRHVAFEAGDVIIRLELLVLRLGGSEWVLNGVALEGSS